MPNCCVKAFYTMSFFLSLYVFGSGNEFFVSIEIICAVFLTINMFHFVPEFSSMVVITIPGLPGQRSFSFSIISNPKPALLFFLDM